MKNFILFFTGLGLLSACVKEKTVEVIKEVPTARAAINIAQPTVGATFRQGDTVRILGTLSAPSGLHGYALSIRDKTNHDKEVFHGHWHVHTASIIVDTIWINTLSGASDMSLKMDAIVDHNGHSEGKEVPFKSVP